MSSSDGIQSGSGSELWPPADRASWAPPQSGPTEVAPVQPKRPQPSPWGPSASPSVPPASSPRPWPPSSGADPVWSDQSPAPVAVVVQPAALSALAVLIGLARFGGHLFSVANRTYLSWAYSWWLAVPEVVLASAGFGAALWATQGKLSQRSATRLLVASALAGGFALNDGLYQLLTLAF
jgi:hypothetical protein